jgi:hypothetical protein
MNFRSALSANALGDSKAAVLASDILKKDGLRIREVRHQTPQLCLTAVIQNPAAIVHCKCITPEVVRAAVSKQPQLMLGISQTETNQLAALEANPTTFKYFANPSELVCMKAVAVDPNIIFTCAITSARVRLAAIRAFHIRTITDDEKARLRYIASLGSLIMGADEALLSEILDMCPVLFKHFPADCSVTIKTKAVKKDANNLAYVPNAPEALALDAIQRHPTAFRFVTNPSFDFCVKAVRARAEVIDMVQDRAYDVWMAAGRPMGYVYGGFGSYYAWGRLPALFDTVRKTAKAAPASVSGPQEDPVTMEDVAAGTLCAFLPGMRPNTWHIVGTIDTIANIIRTKFRDSNNYHVFVPHRNALIPISQLVWFRM